MAKITHRIKTDTVKEMTRCFDELGKLGYMYDILFSMVGITKSIEVYDNKEYTTSFRCGNISLDDFLKEVSK